MAPCAAGAYAAGAYALTRRRELTPAGNWWASSRDGAGLPTLADCCAVAVGPFADGGALTTQSARANAASSRTTGGAGDTCSTARPVSVPFGAVAMTWKTARSSACWAPPSTYDG